MFVLSNNCSHVKPAHDEVQREPANVAAIKIKWVRHMPLLVLLCLALLRSLIVYPAAELNIGQEDYVGQDVQVKNVDLKHNPLPHVPDDLLVCLFRKTAHRRH